MSLPPSGPEPATPLLSAGGPPPRVSVIIPTYNRSTLLCEAVDSVLAQTFGDLEILVVDDGSTDDTKAIVAARFGGSPAVRYLRRENAGPAAARNTGLRASRGELIAFLDSDDLWEKDKLRLQVAQLDEHPEAALSFCDARIEGGRRDRGTRFESKRFQGDTTMRGIVEWNFPMCTPSVVVRRSALGVVGLFDESFACQEDWDLWIRIRAVYPIVYVNRPLLVIRRREDNLSRNRIAEKWRAALRLWQKHADLLRRLGCPEDLIRRKLAHAHKKTAQASHTLGDYPQARSHYLSWWRLRPLQVRGLAWWAILSLSRGSRHDRLPRRSASPPGGV
ncbi:MAG TPA: glycosyltransferase family A protein [Candidatus Polarisedimenticolia bacterium]|nr:glycosyltransferase family A protein [Candidatus Polarisedimenticolia bacterium]